MVKRLLLTIEQASKETGITVDEIKRAIHREELPVFRTGVLGTVKITRVNLEIWLSNRTRD